MSLRFTSENTKICAVGKTFILGEKKLEGRLFDFGFDLTAFCRIRVLLKGTFKSFTAGKVSHQGRFVRIENNVLNIHTR